ncbi:MAG TPA: hypothetical protein VHG71_05220 [Verrucomicrobiae bacterium]|nr:hypothetical protein [Verrucomicrobiae bacterium]
MKRTLQTMVAALILWTAFLCNGHATTNVSLTINNGTNAALHWPSETNQAFIIGYRTTLSAATPWMLLTNVLAATNGIQTDFTNQGAIVSSSSGFYVVSEFDEDFDGDGLDNGTELLTGTDPFVFDDNGDVSYPFAPSVYSGEEVFNYDTNSGAAGNLGPFLYANDTVANTMTTTEPTPGELHLRWTTAVVDHYDSFVKPLDTPPTANFTKAERDLLADAFGEGTSLTTGAISNPTQAKVDQVPIDLLQRYEEFAIEQIDYNFKFIQAINSGEKTVVDIAASTRAQIASIHTQWTREQAICRSLHTRIGRTLGKVLPLLGGVLIIANAADNAQDFINAALAYSNDILRGDDETGDAAIFAGVCNNIAPGSSDLVLGYLLR